jgi:hypothetical protein
MSETPMTVGFQVGRIVDEVGNHDFLYSFFSTISGLLEPDGWGTCFPELMVDLYQGNLNASKATKVLADVLEIRNQLRRFPPDRVIWDIEKPEAQPPWGERIASSITDMSNYFVTSTGRDLFGALIECLTALQHEGGSLTIVSY